MSSNISPASFRDPSGFLFTRQGVLYRQVNQHYREEYDRLMSSELYAELVKAGLLVRHEEVGLEPEIPELAYKVICPQPIPFISYPYEWSFSQLKDAALTTLEIQKRALNKGLSLKDSSAYNIQFVGGQAVLIDTLSFEAYKEGEPWVAYRQFCQHFLAPLALMAYKDVRLSQLLRVYIDGVPLDLAARLLPGRTKFDLSLGAHIHMHAAAQQRYSGKTVDKATASRGMSRIAFLGLIDSLESTVRKLSWKPAGTEWAEYYEDTNYSSQAQQDKCARVEAFIQRIQPANLWDLGANTGLYSRLASSKGIYTVAFDVDPSAVELNYRECKQKKEKNILPLVLDLTNPSPAAGWHNQERMAFLERGPADTVMALALLHHMAISNNVPLPRLAEFFSAAGRRLIIEFVPKGDSQVQRLLSTRLDIFPNYSEEGFEQAFSGFFNIIEKAPVRDSQRILYLMEKK